MKCLISKFIIDSREESGKTLPGFVTSHLKNCPGCRAYTNLGKQLRETDFETGIADSSIHELNNKIFSNLENQSEEKTMKLKRRIFPSVPVAATIFIIVISLGIILFQDIGKPSDTIKEVSLLKSAAARNINDLFTRVESPIVNEAEELKRSLTSAGKYLRSVMDFGLPGIPD